MIFAQDDLTAEKAIHTSLQQMEDAGIKMIKKLELLLIKKWR